MGQGYIVVAPISALCCQKNIKEIIFNFITIKFETMLFFKNKNAMQFVTHIPLLKVNSKFKYYEWLLFRYAAILFKKQKYVSGQHRVNLKIVCKENYKYEVQEKSPANQAVTMQQLAEEYWRYDLISNIIQLSQQVSAIFKID